jgi:penicillin amidase
MARFFRARSFLGSLALTAALLSSCSSDSGSKDPTGGGVAVGDVKVHRDSRGTVHIVADDLPSAMYGLGWATARDRLFQMDFSRRWMQGRLAEWFGAGAGDGVLSKDRTQRVLGFHAFAKQVAETLPADVREQLEAYAKGVNAYASAPGFELPPAYASVAETAFEPWTVADSLLVWDRLAQLFNGNDMDDELSQLTQCRSGNCEQFPGCHPTLDEEAAQVKNPTLASFEPVERFRGEAPRKASHAWVIGASRSTTSKPVLHSDPQTAVTAPGPWYEYHIVAGAVNARGIGVPGAPGFLIFWNQHLAQGLTAAGGDMTDLFELQLSADKTHYLVDGVEKAFTERTETIQVKNAASETLTLKDTVFGPVVDPLLVKLPPGKSYAQRHLNLWKPDDHTLVAALRMLAARNLEEYRAALEHWYAPGANAVYADADGHIAYHALLGIPERSTESAYPSLHGRIPYDGSKSSNDWKGPLPVAARPNSVDPPEGYLFSGNHMVVGSWYPHYTGFAGAGDTDRSLRLRYLLAEKLHQAPGAGPAKPWDPVSPDAKMSPADVLAVHGDAGSDVVRILRDALASLEAAGLIDSSPAGTKARNTLAALAQWKNVLTYADPVTPLAGFLAGESASKFRNLTYPELACEWGGGQPGLSHFLKDIDNGEHDVTTHPASQKFLIEMAAAAWDEMGKPGAPNTWPTTTPTFQVKYQSNFFCHEDGSTSPCPLDDAQSLGVALDVQYVGTILSQAGNSYSQLVDFSALESSRAVMPPGASEDPSSQWFDNQVELWKDGALAPAPTSLESITADSVETVNLP